MKSTRHHPVNPAIQIVLLTLLSLGPLSASAQTVVFDPPYSSVDNGEEFAVALNIDAAALTVKGLDLEVHFDSTIVELLMIEPGSWLTDHPRDWFFFDHTGSPNTPADALRFGMAFLDSSRNDTGQLALAHFRATELGATGLDWLSLEVRGPANETLPFSHSSGDTIEVEPPTALAPAGISRLKAAFGSP